MSYRRLAAWIAVVILGAGAGLLTLIAGVDARDMPWVKRLAIAGMTCLTLALAWFSHRLIRSLDPEDDIRNPDLFTLLQLYLFELWQSILRHASWRYDTVRSRSRSAQLAAQRGFTTFLAEEMVAIRRRKADQQVE
ncbi:MAG: hypothetical protein HQL60_07545 [Magnetococcales bacterium]|nr:hypothetical protein [Magnetococcales bacterium]